MIDRRNVMLGSLFLLGAGAQGAMALRRPARRTSMSLDDGLPKRVGNRAVSVAEAPILPQRDQFTDQIYDDFAVRSYRADGLRPVTLLVAHGSRGGGLEVHRPENCYPPYGYSLSRSRTVTLPLGGRSIIATMLTATRNGLSDQLLFWTRVGDAFPTSQWQTDVAVARIMLRGAMSDGALVRLSVTTPDVATGEQTLVAFARDLIAGVPAEIRGLMIGAGPL